MEKKVTKEKKVRYEGAALKSARLELAEMIQHKNLLQNEVDRLELKTKLLEEDKNYFIYKCNLLTKDMDANDKHIGEVAALYNERDSVLRKIFDMGIIRFWLNKKSIKSNYLKNNQ